MYLLDLDRNQLLEQVQVMLRMLNDENDEDVEVNNMYVVVPEIYLDINVFRVNENLYQKHHRELMDNNHVFVEH